MLAKAREKGLQESLRLGGEIVQARVARLSDRQRHDFVFISPPLNNSGAPLILMQIVREFAGRYGADSVRLLAPPNVSRVERTCRGGWSQGGTRCGGTEPEPSFAYNSPCVRTTSFS